MDVQHIKFDCRHFKGHIPCAPNKEKGAICDTCTDYTKISRKILIIKLAAIGDVIRTTPLLKAFRQQYPNCHFTWVTLFPDILPQNEIDKIHTLNGLSIFQITNTHFDIAINLDKDEEACQLLSKVDATEKFGFTWDGSHICAATPQAEHKLLTGLFDSLSQQNTKSYLEEIFEICHLKFNFEDYAININTGLAGMWKGRIDARSNGRKVIGLNTGCGARWQTRLWPATRWTELIKQLEGKGYFCMLLGGEAEDEQNRALAAATKAWYPGHFSLEEFIAISDSCHFIVTQVSMMMHIAIALKKQLILFNNIFNRHEFELYNRGVILEPDSGCDCYYGNTCSREKSCMLDISVATVVSHIEKIEAGLS